MKFEKEANRLYEKLIEKEVEGEKKYFKEREVFPPFARDGSIRWKEFLIGNWKSFGIVLLIVLITLGVIFEYITNLKIGAECIAIENAKHTLLTSNPYG